MSNLSKTVRVLAKYLGKHDPYYLTANQAAAELQHARLLMPDLPTPDSVKLNGDIKYFFGTGKQVRYNKGSATVEIMVDSPPTTSEARELAYALLSACNHAELNLK